MTLPLNTLSLRVVSTLLCASLAACGGGGGSGSDSGSSVQAGLVVNKGGTATSTATAIAPVGTVQAPPSTIAPVVPVAPTPVVVAPVVQPVAPATMSAITDVRLQNTSAGTAQSSVPVTFGQVFAVGHLKSTDTLLGRLDDNTMVPLQMDIKARHADGSVRHAVVSAVIPAIAAGATRTLTLGKSSSASTAAAATATPAELLGNGFTASVAAVVNGVKYSVSAEDLLKAGAKATWLAGPVANEWEVSAPLKTAAGVAHPHLAARFAVRWYGAVKKARVDVAVENDWAYEPNPQTFTYDTEIVVAGKSVYKKAGLPHYHHARWRKTFWYGGDASQVNIRQNTAYLIASRALPNYDQSIVVPESTLSGMGTGYAGARTEPMAVGMATPYMPTTGGREDIGLMPMWAVTYLLTMDQRARDATLGTADLAGSWSVHFRDAITDQPISLMDHKAMTIAGRDTDTYNDVTRAFDQFPTCATGGTCDTPNTADQAHQASFSYLPYLLTGDHYYLEELQFFTMWNIFWENPGYRLWEKGLLSPGQVRAQAWSLRSLAEAAYITPDSDRLKAHFATMLDNNLSWYNATYIDNATTGNNLGVLVNGYALSYSNGTGIAPWQDDFFTAAVGHAAELGNAKAATLLSWKAKFPVARMTDPAGCWIDGALYGFIVKAGPNAPVFSTFADGWKASHSAEFNAMACNSQAMATNLGVKIGEMSGYSDSTVGYPSNMQPALAYAVDAGATNAKSAWTIFMSRLIKPDYSTGPQFAIIPR